MKKWLSRERLRYWLDCVMSKGAVTMCLLLFAVMVTIVGLIGIAAYLVSEEGSLGFQLWNSFMHTLDAGTLAGNDTGNIPYVVLMTLSTLCGLFVTSVLIGIIATGVENKLNDLSKGTSVVQEELHTVIVGFNDNVYTLLRELIEANANQKRACVVVLGEQPKEEMEEAISARIPHTETTRIICRSGKLHEMYALGYCAVENCRSVIVNVSDDAETVKVLLALSAYLKGKELLHPELRFVASLQDGQYMEAAHIAGEGRAEIICAKDAIARIIANTCRQHGLSQVLTELFDFNQNELYIEKVPELEGRTFREAGLSFSNAIAAGICSKGRAYLNPSMDTRIGKDDRIILIEKDDGVYKVHPVKSVDGTHIRVGQRCPADTGGRLLILGSNDKLPVVLEEYNKYVKAGTQVMIVDDDTELERLGEYANLTIEICNKPVNRALFVELLDERTNNILLLNDDSRDGEASDSQTLLRLILLRDVADKMERQFSITTEMRSVDNQRLATRVRVDDFVIGSNFASLLMSQISENPMIAPVIAELLDESGSELYMKPAEQYVEPGVPVDSYVLAESAARKGEVYVGYRRRSSVSSNVVVNPGKSETVIFEEGDQIVVIAEN